MALTRTTQRWARFWMNGYDLSGYARSIGALDWTFDEADLTALSDNVKGYLPTTCNMTPTVLNGNFDTTATTGLHAVASTAGTSRVVTVAIGMNAEPAQGDYCYCGRFNQNGYTAQDDGGAVTVNIPFGGWDAGNAIRYEIPWGRVLHANSAVTAANTAVGVDTGVTSSALGGYMVYHIFTSAGTSTKTATIKIQDSDTNVDGDFDDLADATTGSIATAAGTSGIVALAKTATVRQYLRWQITLGTATSVTFVLAFVRGIH